MLSASPFTLATLRGDFTALARSCKIIQNAVRSQEKSNIFIMMETTGDWSNLLLYFVYMETLWRSHGEQVVATKLPLRSVAITWSSYWR